MKWDDFIEKVFALLLMLIMLTTIVIIWSFVLGFDNRVAVLPNGIECRNISLNRCGYSLSDCSDGVLRACVTEVKLKEEQK